MKADNTYYGLINLEQLDNLANAVCDCLGHGANGNAVELLVETAGAETIKGTMVDPTLFAGMGLTQFDELPFQDVKDRCRDEDKQKIKDTFDIDIDIVEWEHLRYNPLLALIFTRLKYKKIPQKIPLTLEERAKYWKVHYNSYAGKGTVEHYILANSDRAES